MTMSSSNRESELIRYMQQMDLGTRAHTWDMYVVHCQRYKSQLMAYIRNKTQWDNQRVEEEVEEVLAIGFAKITSGQYQNLGYSIYSYLKGIAWRRLAKFQRVSAKMRELTEWDDYTSSNKWEDVDDQIDGERMITKLLQALNLLSQSDRRVLELRLIDGLKPSQVAQILGISVNNANVRYSRALPKLAAQLVAEEDKNI